MNYSKKLIKYALYKILPTIKTIIIKVSTTPKIITFSIFFSIFQYVKLSTKTKLLNCLCVGSKKVVSNKKTTKKNSPLLRSNREVFLSINNFNKKVIPYVSFCWDYQQFIIKEITFVIPKYNLSWRFV